MLVFSHFFWYNEGMENKNSATRTTDETVTISRAEYESLLSVKKNAEHLEAMNRWYEEQLKIEQSELISETHNQ